MPTWFVDDPKSFTPPPSASGARLTILSEMLDVAGLIDLVGLAPDESWERGSKAAVAAKFAGITFRSGQPPKAEPAEHLAALLRRLQPVAAQVAAAAEDDRVITRLWLVHKIANWNPGLSLPSDLVRLVANLGTGLEVDIYVVDGSATPPPARDIREH